MHLIFNVESKSIYQVCKGGNRLHCLFKYIMNKPDLTCANAYAKVPNRYPPTRNPKKSGSQNFRFSAVLPTYNTAERKFMKQKPI